MRICVVGLGVIGTTYGYVFQKAGHQVEHLLREEKKSKAPESLNISLLDGRYNKKGEEKADQYKVNLAEANAEYDFIILSVASGKIKDASSPELGGSFKSDFCPIRAEVNSYLFPTWAQVICWKETGKQGKVTALCSFSHFLLRLNLQNDLSGKVP